MRSPPMVEVIMIERDMLEDSAELDFGLTTSQAEAQQAVDALHGVRADDDWADDDWAEAGGDETDGPGAERGAMSVESPDRREGYLATSSGGRR
jgi:hypothetical protein